MKNDEIASSEFSESSESSECFSVSPYKYKVLCYFQSPYMSRHESPLTTSPEKLFFD